MGGSRWVGGGRERWNADDEEAAPGVDEEEAVVEGDEYVDAGLEEAELEPCWDLGVVVEFKRRRASS